jgi:hypothetical protein
MHVTFIFFKLLHFETVTFCDILRNVTFTLWNSYTMKLLRYETLTLWNSYVMKLLRYETLMLWNYYIMKLLHYETLTLNDATLRDIYIV